MMGTTGKESMIGGCGEVLDDLIDGAGRAQHSAKPSSQRRSIAIAAPTRRPLKRPR